MKKMLPFALGLAAVATFTETAKPRVKLNPSKNKITRTMKGPLGKLEVYEHLILKNGWEYYLIHDEEYQEGQPSDDIVLAFVMGDENELGSISLEELEPYVISRAKGKELYDIAPADGYEWVD
jgi:hypothetical protein